MLGLGRGTGETSEVATAATVTSRTGQLRGEGTIGYIAIPASNLRGTRQDATLNSPDAENKFIVISEVS
jgi:hypothetical protein